MCVCACMLNRFTRVWLFVTLWTVAHQASLSLGFPRQEYQSGLPCRPVGDLPNPGIKPTSLTSPALAGRFFTTGATWEAQSMYTMKKWSEVKSLSRVRLFVTPWTVAYQAPSMGFSRQEYWSGLPFPSPGDLPDPGIEPRFPALQADALKYWINHEGKNNPQKRESTVVSSHLLSFSYVHECMCGINSYLYLYILFSFPLNSSSLLPLLTFPLQNNKFLNLMKEVFLPLSLIP